MKAKKTKLKPAIVLNKKPSKSHSVKEKEQWLAGEGASLAILLKDEENYYLVWVGGRQLLAYAKAKTVPVPGDFGRVSQDLVAIDTPTAIKEAVKLINRKCNKEKDPYKVVWEAFIDRQTQTRYESFRQMNRSVLGFAADPLPNYDPLLDRSLINLEIE